MLDKFLGVQPVSGQHERNKTKQKTKNPNQTKTGLQPFSFSVFFQKIHARNGMWLALQIISFHKYRRISHRELSFDDIKELMNFLLM